MKKKPTKKKKGWFKGLIKSAKPKAAKLGDAPKILTGIGAKTTKAMTVKRKTVPQVTMENFNKLLPAVDVKTLDDYICGVDSHLTTQQKNLFKAKAMLYKLNPVMKEIYAIGYYDKYNDKYNMSIIVGYEVYNKRAELTGTLDGWRSWTEGSVKAGDLKGCVEIHKRGWKFPFRHEVDHSEYVQRKKDGTITKFWKEKPKTMIKKVAEAQGFRKAYPNVLGGMPYISEELPPEMTTKNITPLKPTATPPAQKAHDTKPSEVLPPVKPTSKRDAILSTLKGSWNMLRAKDKKKYDNKYYSKVLGFLGCDKTADCTDDQLIELTKELDIERRNAK